MNPLIELYFDGGVPFMFTLSVLAAANTAIFVYILITLIRKKPIPSNWLEALKQIGGLAAGWGTWSTLIGLFMAFNAIEGTPEGISQQVISGGLKVALITVLYGLLIFCLSLLAYIVLKLTFSNKLA